MARDVYFVLSADMLLLDLAGPAEAFRIANQLGGNFTLHYVSSSTEVVTSLGLTCAGVQLLPDSLSDHALVVIPGVSGSAEVYQRREAREIALWLSCVLDLTHHTVASICSGALLLAQAGLLHGKACTTHHLHLDDLLLLAPSAHVMPNRVFVQDGSVFSSAGVTAGIDVALHLIAQLASPIIAQNVARHMVVYFRRSPQDPELSPWLHHRNHLHMAVHNAQDLIASNPVHPWSLQELADRIHISTRHLTRLFKEHAGVSVHDYHAGLRVAVARQWLAQGVSKEKAALAAGFSSVRQFNRTQQLQTEYVVSEGIFC